MGAAMDLDRVGMVLEATRVVVAKARRPHSEPHSPGNRTRCYKSHIRNPDRRRRSLHLLESDIRFGKHSRPVMGAAVTDRAVREDAAEASSEMEKMVEEMVMWAARAQGRAG